MSESEVVLDDLNCMEVSDYLDMQRVRGSRFQGFFLAVCRDVHTSVEFIYFETKLSSWSYD